MEGCESLGSVDSGVSAVGICPGRTVLMGIGDEVGNMHFEVEGTEVEWSGK